MTGLTRLRRGRPWGNSEYTPPDWAVWYLWFDVVLLVRDDLCWLRAGRGCRVYVIGIVWRVSYAPSDMLAV